LPEAIKQESETIADAIADFMDEYKIGKSVRKTTPQMHQGLQEFLAVCEQRKKRLLADPRRPPEPTRMARFRP